MAIKNAPKYDASQVVSVCSADFEFPIGGKVSLSLTIAGKTERIWTKFVGFEINKYVLVSLLSPNLDKKFPFGVDVAVRYIRGSIIFGFSTIITGLINNPAPLLVLKYPDCVELLNLRSKHRASCFFPATLFWESNEVNGRVLDISKGGIKIIALSSEENKMPKINVGAEVFVQIMMDNPEDTIYAKSVVRRISLDKNKYIFGLQFLDLPADIQHAIEDYIAKITAYVKEETHWKDE